MGESNPYAGPSSRYPDDETGTTRLVQAFVGFCVGVGLTYAVFVPLGCAYMWFQVGQGVPLGQLYAKAYNSDVFLCMSHLVGFATTVVGGYWTARIGRDPTLIPAILAGVVNIALVGVQYLFPYDFPQPGWSRLLSLAVPLPAYLVGAMLARQLKAHRGDRVR